jgi:hypothetical protein
MAPEQIEKPSDVDHRADIYSLGVVFYELLTGELPLGRFAPPSEKADLDSRVDAIVFRALAKERELRQQSAGEVRTQVEGLGTRPATSAPGAALSKPALSPDLRSQWMRWLNPRADDPANTPWVHSLVWSVTGTLLMFIAAVMALVLARGLRFAGFGPVSGLLAGSIPLITGVLVAFGFVQSRANARNANPGGVRTPILKRVLWFLALAFLTPPFLLIGYLLLSKQSFRQPPGPIQAALPELVAASQIIQLTVAERLVTDSQVRLKWGLVSSQPAEARLSFAGKSKVVPLVPDGGGGYYTIINVVFEPERRGKGVLLSIFGDDATEPATLRAILPGDPRQLLVKANELVAGDLPLKFNTPIWIAFGGFEQVDLEVIPAFATETPETGARVTAPIRLTTTIMDVGGLPEELGGVTPSAAALKWHFAWKRLADNRKKAEVGLVAPHGPEVLAAERDLGLAEAEFRGDPSIAATANLVYATAILENTRRNYAAGVATQAEVNDAILAVAQAQEALQKLQPPPNDGAPQRKN